MPKGYWIAFVTVTDPDTYACYQALAPEAFAKYGARFLVRGGDATPLEGEAWQRHVIVEFESKAQPWPAIIHPNTWPRGTSGQALASRTSSSLMACLKPNLPTIKDTDMTAFDEDLFLKGLAQRKATLGAEYVEKNPRCGRRLYAAVSGSDDSMVLGFWLGR